MAEITCQDCGLPIATFDDWYSAPCPSETPGNIGHRLTWEQIMALEWRVSEGDPSASGGRVVAEQEQQEAAL